MDIAIAVVSGAAEVVTLDCWQAEEDRKAYALSTEEPLDSAEWTGLDTFVHQTTVVAR